MKDIVVGLALKWLVGELASGAGTVDWNGLKAKVAAAIANAVHSAFFDAELVKLANALIDSVTKMVADQTDLLAALQALAAKNVTGAEAALAALVKPYLPADLAALI